MYQVAVVLILVSSSAVVRRSGHYGVGCSSASTMSVPKKAQIDSMKADLQRVKQAAQRRNSGKAPKYEESRKRYLIASGIAGAVIGFALLTPMLSPDRAPEQIPVNDAALIQHVNNNAKSWRARRTESFEGWMIGTWRKMGQIGISTAGMAQTPACNIANVPSLPKNFDVRKKWPGCFETTTVYEMGNCTASWAISAASTLSNRFCISDPDNHQDLMLSAQQLLACDSDVNRGCYGGDIDSVYNFIENHGLVSELCFPYVQKDASRPICTRKFQCADKTHYKGSSRCVLNDAGGIMSEIFLNGPVVALMFLYDDFLVYKEGVYHPMSTATAVTDRRRQPLTHAVKIIGWGVEAGHEYWLIENSFGESWGQNGYAKIKRSKDHSPDYNPLIKRDVVILENYVMSATPSNRRMEAIHRNDENDEHEEEDD